jgi:hypothetical protein
MDNFDFAKQGEVFISYSKEHGELTQALAAALSEAGYSVWWDTSLVSGDDFTSVIAQRLTEAKAVVVVWTPTSVNSDWVKYEAEFGRRSNRLVPVRSADLDPSLIPPPFGFIHTSEAHDKAGILSALAKLGVQRAQLGTSRSHAQTDAGWESLRAGAAEMKRAALAPLVAQSVRLEMRNNQDEMADVMYPMAGRLAKSALADGVKDMMQQFDRRMNSRQLFSPFRSAVTGAAITDASQDGSPLKGLYLVRRKSGEVLLQWPAGGDAGMSMPDVAAIFEFVQQAANPSSSIEVQSFDFGEGSMHVVFSPSLLVAARCSAAISPPAAKLMAAMLEDLHQRFDAMQTVANDGQFGDAGAKLFDDAAYKFLENEKKSRTRVGKRAVWAQRVTALLAISARLIGLLAISIVGAALWDRVISKHI